MKEKRKKNALRVREPPKWGIHQGIGKKDRQEGLGRLRANGTPLINGRREKAIKRGGGNFKRGREMLQKKKSSICL